MSPDSSKIADFRLRPATAADEPFLIGLYATTREREMDMANFPPEMRDQFVRMQFAAQTHHYQTYFSGSIQNIIEVDGQAVGREWVYRSEFEINVLDILLTPAFCGRGIGTTIFNGLLDESRETGVPVTLYVEKYNARALNLYLRLGFVITDDTEVYYAMKWTPAKTVEL